MLMEDLDTRSVVALEYMKEKGGVTDERLAKQQTAKSPKAKTRIRK